LCHETHFLQYFSRAAVEKKGEAQFKAGKHTLNAAPKQALLNYGYYVCV